MSKLDDVYHAIVELQKSFAEGVTANDVSNFLELDRANVSRYLNQLYKEKKVKKIDGRPVVYSAIEENREVQTKDDSVKSNDTLKIVNNSLDSMVGADLSLQVPIQQAKAAILYPPRGLHTLILGETGVGKSMFAELMYTFAKESGALDSNAPFVRFNCADYADNPQLVIAQIFGVKKGAYTGAESDREGLLKKADGGMIFLDEIHRLSPQAQEMLFTYIDKGYFRPLGDTENLIHVDAQIIAATTEDPASYLLKTFTRRIPMTITLPSLKERSLKERYYLLQDFIKGESNRLGKSIYFNKNALISFFLYDCPNNIGQLRSDIQLSCAKAFLNYKANGRNYIIVEQNDIPQRVQRGLMKLQEHRDEIDDILLNVGDVLRFSFKDQDDNFPVIELDDSDISKREFFYDIIENKLEVLRQKGIEEKQINEILNIDIERYFNKYIMDLPEKFRKDEISKIVDIKIVDLVEKIINLASAKLARDFDEKVYFGLALHLQGSIERVKQGKKIYHPKLNLIRAQYGNEFLVAMEVAKFIDDAFDIQIPLDEIGYLTMFLAAKPYEVDIKKEGKVGVLVIMHGHSTASSMVEVANSLIGEEYVEALDMPLSMKAEDMLKLAKSKIKNMHKGKGILLLVDMGSLTNFGEIIKVETGISIKTIDMVTTLLVIEAGRKALNGRDLDSVYDSCVEVSRFGVKGAIENSPKRKMPLIITTCFTGEGSAERIKEILKKKLKYGSSLKIIPLNILDKKEFYDNVAELKEKYEPLAIVGTVNLTLDNIPFISAPDILTSEGIQKLDELIEAEEDFIKVSDSIDEQIPEIEGKKLVEDIRFSLSEMEELLNKEIPHNVKIGMIMHICFLIDTIKNGGKEREFPNLNKYRSSFSKEFILVKQALKNMEREYDLNIVDSEIAFIVRMIVENTKTVY
ncbi:sigma-54-dependent transcriptional regulator [Clostridium paridis]|uniref:Sigma 54-interacting transcriptional regulator n=1 Tax=Clostridium paridis TaxID=2803863 RepID=A0A937K5T2_9CLOT|nr:sigma-54-dependent transcriptional regulator [Clostridium paridis]MBL4932730.1 sigma 54-interacting transcriptional regulator [Clostridium paridis]